MADRADVPRVHFADANGARIAYQRHGLEPGPGTAVVVGIPPFAQHIEMAWERPEIRRMLLRIGSFCHYVHFDKRGSGSSDRRSRAPGIDERVDDLKAVMDDAGIERAHLFAQSEGGPMSLLFAASFPDRVESIVLVGSGACTTRPIAREDLAAARERNAWVASVWGTPESPVVGAFAPSIADDPEFCAWHQRYERAAASADSLKEMLDITIEIDVTDVLPDVRVPVLVLHRVDDPIVPLENGRAVAEAVEGARMIEHPGHDHFAYVGDQTWLEDMERFVTGTVRPRRAEPAAEAQVEIRTLGRFAVLRDGQEVPTAEWGSRRARVLLKRLVAARGWPVTRDELIDLLWPDEDDRVRLGARLSVQLSGVRRVLGGGIIADRETVRLDHDHVSTDLEQFFAAEDDEAIVDAYGGELLPEDRYDDWSAALREDVRARFAGAAHTVAERALVDGRPERAAELARQCLDADRFDDAAHRLLIRARAASGDVSGAHRAHEDWTAAMREIDIDVAPLDDLVGGRAVD